MSECLSSRSNNSNTWEKSNSSAQFHQWKQQNGSSLQTVTESRATAWRHLHICEMLLKLEPVYWNSIVVYLCHSQRNVLFIYLFWWHWQARTCVITSYHHVHCCTLMKQLGWKADQCSPNIQSTHLIPPRLFSFYLEVVHPLPLTYIYQSGHGRW